jgi:hypothetical protein
VSPYPGLKTLFVKPRAAEILSAWLFRQEKSQEQSLDDLPFLKMLQLLPTIEHFSWRCGPSSVGTCGLSVKKGHTEETSLSRATGKML